METNNSVNRAINSLALLKSSEAGALDSKIENAKLAGVLGSLSADTQKTLNEYSNGLKTMEQVKAEVSNHVKSATTATTHVLIDKILGKPLDIAGGIIKMFLPNILSPVVDIAKHVVKTIIKSKVAEKLIEYGGKVANKIKGYLKHITS